MKKRLIKTIILCFTLLWIAVAAFFKIQEPLYFLAVTNDHTEKIDCWEKEPGDYYVFLPSYADLSQCIVQSDWPVYIGQQKLTHGMSCENLQLNEPYSLSGGFRKPAFITFMKSENIPAMYIDTKSGRMDKIHKEKGLEESGSLRLYTDSGSLDYEGDLKSIKMRGNNTSLSKQESYSLKFTQDENLLDMGAAQKWVLVSNYFDPSHLRNKIVQETARKVQMPYTPENYWVDLYLNGEYVGVYLLFERNEVHPERVNLPEAGSFLLSQEVEYRLVDQNLPYFKTDPCDRGSGYRIRYEGMNRSEIVDVFNSIRNAIYDPNGIDPRTNKHWTELIDLDSWVRKYLLEEVFGNVDGGMVSQFFFLDGGDPTGKVQAGPPWDYDMSMGNPSIFLGKVLDEGQDEDYDEMNPNIFYVNCNPENFGSPFFFKLYQDPIFYNRMLDIYQQDFLPLLAELIDQEFDTYAETILPAAQMNQLRWSKPDAEYCMKKLKTYLPQRIAFLNRIWLENEEYASVVSDFLGRMTTYIIFKGDTLPKLPISIGREWCYADTGVPVDLSLPIYEDMEIKMMTPVNIPLTETVEEIPPEFQETLPDSSITDIPAPSEQRKIEEEEEYEEGETDSIEPIPLRKMIPQLALITMLMLLILADILRTKRSDSNKNAN